MPPHSKLAHVFAVVVSAVIAVAVATVLADGTSVIKLKDAKYLKPITHSDYKAKGLDFRADELLGSTYGIGLHHDQSGFWWSHVAAGSTLKELIDNLGEPAVIAAVPSVISTDDLKHPVPFLGCKDLEKAGLAAMIFGFIAEIVAVLMVIFHLLMLVGMIPAKAGKILGSLIWLVLTVGFLTVMMLAIGIYTADWDCDNPFIPKIRISDHFNWNYGFPFAITGYVSSLLVLVVTMTFTSTQEGTAAYSPPTRVILKLLCGITIGVVVGVVASVSVGAGTGAYNHDFTIDPSINPCEGMKPDSLGPGDKYFKNTQCMKDAVVQTLEQAGANVTKGYKGKLNSGDRIPITKPYTETDLCPVNVHWHLGAEHLSVGEFDERGSGPMVDPALTKGTRLGFQCHKYSSTDSRFNDTLFKWENCVDMKVGQTYEIHWPHSAAGECGSEWQYQSPFYDGVFCNEGMITIAPLNTYKKIGVQSQTFTVINDEDYYYGDLIKGMIVDDVSKGTDIAMYTGSTTGTSRDNNVCSRFTPITWQVDRKCHLISASSFEKLCADMKAQRDDMSYDLHPHGSRELVADHLVADNQVSRG